MCVRNSSQTVPKVRDLVPESQAYMDLLTFERKLDATIMRKRLEIQETLRRPLKQKRKLRVFISHQFFTVEPENGVSLSLPSLPPSLSPSLPPSLPSSLPLSLPSSLPPSLPPFSPLFLSPSPLTPSYVSSLPPFLSLSLLHPSLPSPFFPVSFICTCVSMYRC